MGIVTTAIVFVIALIVSAVIIYVVTRMFGETEGMKTALIAALAGTVIYGIVYFLIGQGIIAAVLGGIAWLIALRSLYRIGWLKSLVIAAIIWVVTAIVGWFLPTLTGPL